MSVVRRAAIFIGTFTLAAALTGPGQALAQAARVEVPANAYLTNSSYGRGWACQRGYEAVAETCVVIPVPPNAYLESSGDRWKCDRGYSKVAGSCLAIEIPPNAYLNAIGTAWECERGYREGREIGRASCRERV